ncbi:MAG: methionine synthase, partial [Candidatus Omnitrophica bacterium]|nr:methionine synthase [Candidatus Omnitrophota bacterium]
LENFDLNKIRPRIDWTFFFIGWELRGKYPEILHHPKFGEEARRLYQEGNELLDEIIDKKFFKANGVVGIYPANSVEDDIEVYADETRKNVAAVFHTLRQQVENEQGAYYALSDFIAPKDSGVRDYIGAFAVTAGLGVEEFVKRHQKDQNDYKAIMAKILADLLAERFAEVLHYM